MSNQNCLLSQKLCHYLNQNRTLNDLRSISECAKSVRILFAMVTTVWHL